MSWYMGLAPSNMGSIFPAIAPVIMDMDGPWTVVWFVKRRDGQREGGGKKG